MIVNDWVWLPWDTVHGFRLLSTGLPFLDGFLGPRAVEILSNRHLSYQSLTFRSKDKNWNPLNGSLRWYFVTKMDSRNINQNNPQRQRLDRVNVPSDRPMGAVESEKTSFRYINWPWVLHYSWFEIKFSKTSSSSQLSRNIRHAPLTFFRASFSSFAIQKTKMESFVECSVGGERWMTHPRWRHQSAPIFTVSEKNRILVEK